MHTVGCIQYAALYLLLRQEDIKLKLRFKKTVLTFVRAKKPCGSSWASVVSSTVASVVSIVSSSSGSSSDDSLSSSTITIGGTTVSFAVVVSRTTVVVVVVTVVFSLELKQI